MKQETSKFIGHLIINAILTLALFNNGIPAGLSVTFIWFKIFVLTFLIASGEVHNIKVTIKTKTQKTIMFISRLVLLSTLIHLEFYTTSIMFFIIYLYVYIFNYMRSKNEI